MCVRSFLHPLLFLNRGGKTRALSSACQTDQADFADFLSFLNDLYPQGENIL